MAVSMFVLPASAAYTYYGKYSFSTGALWWKENYTAKVYRDPNWFLVFYGNDKLSTGFEYKGNTDVVLSQTRSFSIGKQTVSTLNSELSVEEFGIKAGVGGSISSSSSQSWGISNTSTRTILASAPKGYYSYNVCLNVYKMKVVKYQNESKKGQVEFYAPKDSQPYRAIVYNKNSASYSGVSLY